MFYTRHKSQTYILHLKLAYDLISGVVTVWRMFITVLVLLSAFQSLLTSQVSALSPNIHLSLSRKRRGQFDFSLNLS